MTSSISILTLLSSLPLSHPSFIPLLQTHKPLSIPSDLPQQTLSKLLLRLNTSLISRSPDPEASSDRQASFSIAKELVHQDKEGYVLLTYGKQWVTSCLVLLGGELHGMRGILELLVEIVRESRGYPSFEREAIHPIMGKVGIAVGKAVERCIVQNDWEVLLATLRALFALISHSPTPFRPLIPSLKPHLHHLLSTPAPIPDVVKRSAADLLASLHTTLGKAQAPAAWGTEMKEALGGIGYAMGGLVSEAWEEEALRVTPPSAPSNLPPLPVDAIARLPISLSHLEGHTETILSLLRFPTSRPVPIPVAQIVAAGLRCLSLTLDTPTVTYITPQHHAALLASLPRIWTVGSLLISGIAVACEDHLFPHLSLIFDHTVWLLERIPSSMTESKIQLLKFHHLLLTIYPTALIPIEYPTRLLKLSLSSLSPLLETKAPASVMRNGGGGGGKRGKKRARMGEDGLVASLEGREGRDGISTEEIEVVLAALELTPLLHPAPLLSPALLTFSIRLHLALHLVLPSNTFIESASSEQLRQAVQKVLEDAVMMTEGEQGTSRGWKSVILSVLRTKDERLSAILHPSLPPMNRPQPPLAALHYFSTETEEELGLRKELGFGAEGDADAKEMIEHEEDVVMVAPVPVVKSQPQVWTNSTTSTAVKSDIIAGDSNLAPPAPGPDVISALPHVQASRPLPVDEQNTSTETALSKSVSGIDPNFISSVTSGVKGKEVIEVKVSTTIGDDEDEEMLELDSGSEDDEENEDEDEDDDGEGDDD